MPGMTGAELATEIRERPGHRVIIAAGFAGSGKGAGAEFPKLSKPFSRTTSGRDLRSNGSGSRNNGSQPSPISLAS